jgi:hypothetical protein
MPNDLSGAWQGRSFGSRPEPVAYLSYAAFRVSSMRAYILTGYVGNECAISVRLAVENQRPLLTLIGRAEPLAPEEKPEFKRHIEARQSRGGVQRDRGEIVNSEPALLDNALDFGQSDLSGIVIFPGASSANPR